MAALQSAVFVGCASEDNRIANALVAALRNVGRDDPRIEQLLVNPWKLTYQLGRGNLSNLVRAARRHDFAAFIVSPIDITESRGHKVGSPRDNVIYELGLFTGIQGEGHVFAVRPEDSDLKWLTDLSGISDATFTPPDQGHQDHRSLVSAMTDAASQIADDIVDAMVGEPADEELDIGMPFTPTSSSAINQLVIHLLVDAQRGSLESPQAEDLKQGFIVVHSVHGIGKVLGWDPPGVESLVRVRFDSGIGLVPLAELFTPPSQRTPHPRT